MQYRQGAITITKPGNTHGRHVTAFVCSSAVSTTVGNQPVKTGLYKLLHVTTCSCHITSLAYAMPVSKNKTFVPLGEPERWKWGRSNQFSFSTTYNNTERAVTFVHYSHVRVTAIICFRWAQPLGMVDPAFRDPHCSFCTDPT